MDKTKLDQIAHDMRAPLSVVTGYIEADLDPNDPAIKEFRDAAQSSAKKLLELLSQLSTEIEEG